jgi:hypothetical protein
MISPPRTVTLMEARILLMLVASLVVTTVGCGHESAPGQQPLPAKSSVTPLAACQAVPPGLPESLLRAYDRVCSATNADGRWQALHQFPRVQLPGNAPQRARDYEDRRYPGIPRVQRSDMVKCLPLLAEIMASDDFISPDGFRRGYLARAAAYVASDAGVDAVPFVVRALQSRKAVEVHAGLACTQYMVSALEWRGETNQLAAVCSNLLPYVVMCATNGVPDDSGVSRAFLASITNTANETYGVLTKHVGR